jgi:hypothetical protein
MFIVQSCWQSCLLTRRVSPLRLSHSTCSPEEIAMDADVAQCSTTQLQIAALQREEPGACVVLHRLTHSTRRLVCKAVVI